MSLWRRLFNVELVEGLLDLCQHQQEIMRAQKTQLDGILLAHARHSRDLIEQFLLALDGPEEPLREKLIEAMCDLSDEVARLEEHHAPR